MTKTYTYLYYKKYDDISKYKSRCGDCQRRIASGKRFCGSSICLKKLKHRCEYCNRRSKRKICKGCTTAYLDNKWQRSYIIHEPYYHLLYDPKIHSRTNYTNRCLECQRRVHHSTTVCGPYTCLEIYHPERPYIF